MVLVVQATKTNNFNVVVKQLNLLSIILEIKSKGQDVSRVDFFQSPIGDFVYASITGLLLDKLMCLP